MKFRVKVGPAARRLFRKRLRTIALALILFTSVLTMCIYSYYSNMLRRVEHEEGYYFPEQTQTAEEISGLAAELALSDTAALDAYLKGWAGEDIPYMSDRLVMNILLCGVDTADGEAISGRADAIMLVSINKRRHTITLTSLLRDSYAYIDLRRDPVNPRSVMDRISSAYSLGGPATLVETLEAHYKIKIDGYVSVDLKSFPQIIDALDGVYVDITAEEAAFVNRTAPSQRNAFPAGAQVKLGGEQALIYSRIRSLDSDVARTGRQRQVILAILARAKEASPGQIINAVTGCLGYVRTNFTQNQLETYAKDALTQGWLKFPLTQTHSPIVQGDNLLEGNISAHSTYISERFLWLVDYPGEARRLQTEIYGGTNIPAEISGKFFMEISGQES